MSLGEAREVPQVSPRGQVYLQLEACLMHGTRERLKKGRICLGVRCHNTCLRLARGKQPIDTGRGCKGHIGVKWGGDGGGVGECVRQVC